MRPADRPRRPAYAVAWQWAQDRRCLGCGRWLAESGVSGFDLRRRRRWCEPCLVVRLRAWPGLVTACATAVTGAA